MLNMAIMFQYPINQLIQDFNHGLLKEIAIPEKEWTQLTNLRDILYLFYEPTIFFQGLTYPTLSLTLNWVNSIYEKLLDFKQLYIDELNLREEDGVSKSYIYIFI
jgi:hypothetical protein